MDRVGPIPCWERRDSGKLVLFTSFQGNSNSVEYHVEKGNFSEAYAKIINKSEPRNIDPKLRAVLGSFGQFPCKSEKKPNPTQMKKIKFRRSHSPPRASTVKQINQG